jgi:hypothetical protein
MDLYRFSVEVSLTVEHPLFWRWKPKWKTGHLCIWLFAACSDDAKERAESILSQLPYEAAGESSCVLASEARRLATEAPKGVAEHEKCRETEARELGIAISVHAMPVHGESFLEAIPDSPQPT